MLVIESFREKPLCDASIFEPGEFDITYPDLTKTPPNDEEYCQLLLYKIFYLPPHNIHGFFNYQASLLKDSSTWLRQLKAFLSNNLKAISATDLPHFKFAIMISETLLSQAEALLAKPEHKTPCSTPPPIDSSPILRSTHSVTEPTNRITNTGFSVTERKYPVNGNLNVLIDAFYQLVFEKKTRGQPYLDITLPELVTLITSTFLDKEHRPLSVSTVRTMLSPNKIDKRPKIGTRINLERNHA